MIIHKLCKEFFDGQPVKIDLAGVGGNGSQVLTGLARMHLALKAVGHPGLDVTAFDPDTVTAANVGRQLFSPSDIGQPKATILIHRLNCYFGLEWSGYCSCRVRRPSDILIGCVDSISARRELAQSAPHYWLDLGNRDRTGQVILGQPVTRENKLDPLRLRTVMELFPEMASGKLKEDDAPSCSLAEALERQDLFINQSVATFALQLLWSLLRNGQTSIQGYFINLETGRVVPIPVVELDVPKPKAKGKTLVKILGHRA
jgi:PRTRC genetic system ThiF family protein